MKLSVRIPENQTRFHPHTGPIVTASPASPVSVARNPDHYTTEAVYFILHKIYKFSSYLTGSTIHLRSVASNSDH
jgi:hypothetical protein